MERLKAFKIPRGARQSEESLTKKITRLAILKLRERKRQRGREKERTRFVDFPGTRPQRDWWKINTRAGEDSRAFSSGERTTPPFLRALPRRAPCPGPHFL